MLDKTARTGPLLAGSDHSAVFKDHFPDKEEVTTTRSLLHSCKAVSCFPVDTAASRRRNGNRSAVQVRW
ncbi:MAG: hypothetical protein ACFFD4_09775 [Candidatus Odinarchaeota archaeon]